MESTIKTEENRPSSSLEKEEINDLFMESTNKNERKSSKFLP